MFSTRTPDGAVLGRPRLVLVNAALWTVLLTGGSLLGWFALPPHVRALFTIPQIATLLFIEGFIVCFLWAVGLSYVRADAAGLRFRNGLRSHTRTWDDVAHVRYLTGDPWAFLELHEPIEKLPLMGIMRTDGERADGLIADLRALHRASREA